MGFNDVQNISPKVVAPLFHDPAWVKAFSILASSILNMLSEIKSHESKRLNVYDYQVIEDESTWPPVAACFLLQRYVDKNRAVGSDSLDAHRMLIYALKVSKDISALAQCIPSFYDLFTPGALFNKAVASDKIDEKQHEFLQDAIVSYARTYSGASMDTLDLGETDILALLWYFDMVNAYALFLLSMYEFGKDRIVDEAVPKSASLISVQHFCDDGVDIMCHRLNDLLHVHATEIRETPS